jgi:23S rRNA G2069 N7-methylase RlmK/C1962 C5-methylase RlmI
MIDVVLKPDRDRSIRRRRRWVLSGAVARVDGTAEPGARVLAFAHSHHLGPDLFRETAFGAALDAGRSVRVLGAPADCPVSLDHPEGAYLTGLLLSA